jgi:formate transporter
MLWNQIPVTLGNLVGGFTFTGLALYATYKPATSPQPMIDHMAAKIPAE